MQWLDDPMTQSPDHSISQFLSIAKEWEAEFERNRRLYGEKIHCRKGCSDCCSQMFQITEVEAAYLSRGVKKIEHEKRNRMEERARRYLPEREKLLAGKGVQMPGATCRRLA